MFCTTLTYFTLDQIFVCLKLFLRKFTKCFDVQFCLKFCQSFLALCAALVVFGIPKTTLLVAACDNNLLICQFDRCICIGKITGIQKDSLIFFAHCDGKLIHDTTIYTIKVILGILTKQCNVNHGNIIISKEITQCYAGYNFYGCRRGKSGTIRDISK